MIDAEFVIYCADVGSIRAGNFGWASCRSDGSQRSSGTSIQEFADAVSTDFKARCKVALGFECPLFVPLPEDPVELTRARRGEGSRPWCAGAGSGALAVGLTESAWVLLQMHRAVSPQPPLFFGWDAFVRSDSGLLLWEAFVSGASKASSHEEDAALAVNAFLSALPNPEERNIIEEQHPHSLIAAAALRAGWKSAASLIDQSCLVIAA